LEVDLRRQAQRAVTGLHARVYRLTGGRLGRSMGAAEAVLLTTTGRKSGAARTTPLTVVPDGDRLVLIASNGGAQKHPDWYLNLLSDPSVTIQRGGTVTAMRARTAGPEERATLWAKAVSIYGGYAQYQTKTEREIPVVICEPVTSA
jgi:deazaflavin-dependent oxidoreductase (nitroreductase family)